jgi:hypothetical protein
MAMRLSLLYAGCPLSPRGFLLIIYMHEVTHFVELSPLSEAKLCSASQEFCLYHCCMFPSCSGNNMSTELFPSNGCHAVCCLHSCYLAVGLHATMLYKNTSHTRCREDVTHIFHSLHFCQQNGCRNVWVYQKLLLFPFDEGQLRAQHREWLWEIKYCMLTYRTNYYFPITAYVFK